MSIGIPSYLKFTGVSPAAIPLLHEVLKNDTVKCPKDVTIAVSGTRGAVEVGRPALVELQKAEFNTSWGTYTVELLVYCVVYDYVLGRHGAVSLYRPPISILQPVLDALGVLPLR